MLALLGEEAQDGSSVVLSREQKDSAQELCRLAQEVESALRSVCDFASAEAAAGRIHLSRQRMLQALARIESHHPLTQEEAAHLGDLTRMMQGLLPLMSRLRDVNSYGSEALMAELEDYAMEAQDPGELVENTHQVRLYTTILETMDDVILALRKIQHSEPGEMALSSLEAKVRRLHEKSRLLSALCTGMSEEEREAVVPLKEQRMRLKLELKQEIERVRERQKPLESRLLHVLEACCQEGN